MVTYTKMMVRAAVSLSCLLQLNIVYAKDSSEQAPYRLDRNEDWFSTTTPSLCGGEYRLPSFTTPYDPGTIIQADHGELSQVQASQLSGNVLVEQLDKRVRADKLTLYRDPETREANQLIANSQVLFENPTMRVQSDAVDVDLTTQHYQFDRTFYRLYDWHARGQASSIDYQNDQIVHLKNGTYTSCSPDSNFWEISAKSVRFDKQKGTGKARGATLSIKNIPVLYTPYLSFSVNKARKTGLLTPNFSSSSALGAVFSQPLYLNLAPNYDDTLTTHWYAKRGLGFSNAFRYLGKQQHFDADLNILPHDLDTGDERYSYQLHFDKKFKPWLRLDASYSDVSDDNYFADFATDINTANSRQLLRSVNVNALTTNWSVQFVADSYKTLQPDNAKRYEVLPYHRLPGLSVQYNSDRIRDHWYYQIDTTYNRFESQTNPNGSTQTTGQRLTFTPKLGYLYQSAFAYFKPSLSWDFTQYNLDNVVDNVLRRNLWEAHVDTGVFFERETHLFQETFTQTLEPTLQYTYSPYRAQSHLPLFDTLAAPLNFYNLERQHRFVGHDRIGDSNQLIASVATRWLEESDFFEKANIQVSQLVYFSDPKVTVCSAADCIQAENPAHQETAPYLAYQGNYQLDQTFSLSTAGLWHYKTQSLEQYLFGASAKNDVIQSVGVSYQRIANLETVQDDVTQVFYRQIESHLAWKLSTKWNILARWYYDLGQKALVDSEFGLGYEDCCWSLRAGVRRYQKPGTLETNNLNNAFYLQFNLKGLTG